MEVNQPVRGLRPSRREKADADAAARPVRTRCVASQTGDGRALDVSILLLARESRGVAQTQAMDQLNAVLLGVDPELRESLPGLSNSHLIARCAALIEADDAAVVTMQLPARLIQQPAAEAGELARRRIPTVRPHDPQLLEIVGAGHDSAGALLIADGDNACHPHSEASFAALGGAIPVDQ